MAAADPGRRRIVGAGLPIPRPAAFVLPREYRSHHFFVPPALAPLARRLLGARPTVTSLCTVCGICASVCPARALRRENRRMVVDERRCIRCYCCHEMCPRGAVVLRQGLVGRLWPGG